MAALALKLALLALVATAAVVTSAAQPTAGCGSHTADGLFTLNGKCYLMRRKNAANSGGGCNNRCHGVNMACLDADKIVAGTLADCTALIDAYLGSSANDLPITNPSTGTAQTCALVMHQGSWQRNDKGESMPKNLEGCGFDIGDDSVFPCECVEAPTITDVSAVFASDDTVTVTGTTDTAGNVYCRHGSNGFDPPDGDAVVGSNSPMVTVGSAGSFTITLTGVTSPGRLLAYCVGENTNTGAVSPTSAASPEFARGERGAGTAPLPSPSRSVLTCACRLRVVCCRVRAAGRVRHHPLQLWVCLHRHRLMQ